jgi:hypothetical protein
MKRSTVAAIIIAVLLIGAFAFFNLRSKTTAPPNFSIVGTWQLDSAYAPATASPQLQTLTAALNEAGHSQALSYEFSADSTLRRKSLKDDITEQYYLQDSTLYIKESNSFAPYPFTRISDSLIHFSNTDSVVFVLKRK